MMHEAGIRIVIASNNNEERVKQFAEPLRYSVHSSCKKTIRRGLLCRRSYSLRLKRDEVAMVGDQLLTDVMGAKRQKLYTIFSTSSCGVGWSCYAI